MKSSNHQIARIRKILGANSYAQVVTLGIQLFTIPLFLHYWGSERYGQWIFLLAISSVLAISDFGVSTIYGNRIAKSWTQNRAVDLQRKHKLALGTIVFTVATSVLGALAILAIAKKYNNTNVNFTTFALLCLYTAGGVLTSYYVCLLRAIGRNATGIYISNSTRLVELIAVALALAVGFDEPGIACIYLGVRVIGVWVITRTTINITPLLSPIVHLPKPKSILKIVSSSAIVMSFPIGLNVSLNGTIFIIGNSIGPSAVTLFTSVRTLTRFLIQASAVFSQAVWPEFTSAFASKDILMQRKLHANLFLWNGILSVSGALFLSMFGELIFSFWTSNRLMLPDSTLLFLLATALVTSLWQGSWVYLLATNQASMFARIFLVANLLVMLLMLSTSRHGIDYVAASLLCCELVLLFSCTAISLNKLSDTISGQLAIVSSTLIRLTKF